MASPHDIRRLAFQALFQLDARDGGDVEDCRAMVEERAHELGMRPAEAERALEMAIGAFENRREADRLSGEQSPAWPAHRQPAADRAVIRLGVHELKSGRVSAAVAIDEAVELAKEFGGERSPGFVNAVLDGVRRVLERADAPGEEAAPADAPQHESSAHPGGGEG